MACKNEANRAVLSWEMNRVEIESHWAELCELKLCSLEATARGLLMTCSSSRSLCDIPSFRLSDSLILEKPSDKTEVGGYQQNLLTIFESFGVMYSNANPS